MLQDYSLLLPAQGTHCTTSSIFQDLSSSKSSLARQPAPLLSHRVLDPSLAFALSQVPWAMAAVMPKLLSP